MTNVTGTRGKVLRVVYARTRTRNPTQFVNGAPSVLFDEPDSVSMYLLASKKGNRRPAILARERAPERAHPRIAAKQTARDYRALAREAAVISLRSSRNPRTDTRIHVVTLSSFSVGDSSPLSPVGRPAAMGGHVFRVSHLCSKTVRFFASLFAFAPFRARNHLSFLRSTSFSAMRQAEKQLEADSRE